jgi:UDP-2,3-diacylglucosamine hydrolase
MAVVGEGGDQSNEGRDPLAIVCGGGSLPLAVADLVAGRGRRVVLFPLRGWADPVAVARYPHHWIGLAQIVRLQRLLRREGCRELVFIGAVQRPSPRQLRPDLGTLWLLPRFLRLFWGGDNNLLSGVGRLFEERGFRLVGAHEVAPEILMPEGSLGRRQPGAGDYQDIVYGLEFLRATGAFDVGQAAVISRRHILAVEAAEGTDQMLARVAELRTGGRLSSQGGVLVKAPKPGQDRRIDLPTIGPHTVELAARAQLSGIAVVAGSTIVAEAHRVGEAADRANIFAIGVRGGGSGE